MATPDLTAGDYTTSEKARLTWLIARMAKRGVAGDAVDLSDLQHKFDRIQTQARKRKQQGK
ncbi:DUF6257 family protein [Streptomyces sp. NBC_00334]|uniref:DUF6257 family protein n=1 Tax=Streptomyces sp. NBC_00334 TaxID=2975713 RepID=UPI002E27D969|nr:DUF6257 family protein [Streptomyces sp. NBC_00334]